ARIGGRCRASLRAAKWWADYSMTTTRPAPASYRVPPLGASLAATPPSWRRRWIRPIMPSFARPMCSPRSARGIVGFEANRLCLAPSDSIASPAIGSPRHDGDFIASQHLKPSNGQLDGAGALARERETEAGLDEPRTRAVV